MSKQKRPASESSWIVQVYEEKHVDRKKFDTCNEASSWASEIARELNQRAGSDFDNLRFSDLLDRYGREISPSKVHHLKDLRRIRFFKTQLTEGTQERKYPIVDVLLKDLSRRDFIKFRDQRLKEVADGTFIRDWSLFSSASKIAANEWGWLHRNPLEGIRIPKEPAHRRRRVSQEEIYLITRSLLKAKEKYRFLDKRKFNQAVILFHLAIETALRISELLALRRSEVLLDRGYLNVTGIEKFARKTASSVRSVPLTQYALMLLESALNQNWDDEFIFSININTFSNTFTRAVRDAGIQDLHFHDTRHEAVSRLARHYKILDLARIVGHQEIKTLLTYYEPTIDELVEVLQKREALRPAPPLIDQLDLSIYPLKVFD